MADEDVVIPNDDASVDLDTDDTATSALMEQKEGETIDLTKEKDGGVMKKLLVKGKGWKRPEAGDEVFVHYTGRLTDGTEFDSSVSRGQPFSFTLGCGNVIKGWDVGVATMLQGEKCLLTCAPEYAYGDRGAGDKIKPGATLEFEVELLHWKSVKELTNDGGVIKKIVKEGSGWENPKDVDEIKVSYKVCLKDGTVVKEVEGEEFEVRKAPSKGLEVAVKSMKKGETALCSFLKVADGVDYVGSLASADTVDVTLTVDSWKKVTKVKDTDDKVLKKVLVDGEGYEKPNEGATVVLADIEGKLEDGTVFETIPELTIKTDAEEVCEGLERAVMEMKKGETALVTIPAEFAFGAAGGKGGKVPGGATVQYTLTVKSFEKEKESWDLHGDAEKLGFAEEKKNEANALVAGGKHKRAVRVYARGLKAVEYDSSMADDIKKKVKALKATIHSNTALCHLKLGDMQAAAQSSKKALELDGGNIKALFRRAQANSGLEDFFEAERDLKKILELDADNKEAKRELAALKRKQREKDAADAQVFGKVFGKLAKQGLYRDVKVVPGKKSDEDAEASGAGADDGEGPLTVGKVEVEA